MSTMTRWSAAALCGLFLSLEAGAMDAKIVMEEFMVPAVDPGISLYVRNKHPEGVSKFAPAKILLYVHGATYPAETAFDLPLNGLSWMEYIARRGYDVYLVDVRGYGKSTRPPEMDKPARESAPIVRTETAVKDVLGPDYGRASCAQWAAQAAGIEVEEVSKQADKETSRPGE